MVGRYLVVLYYQPAKFQRRAEAEEKQKELDELRRRVQKKKEQIAAKGDNWSKKYRYIIIETEKGDKGKGGLLFYPRGFFPMDISFTIIRDVSSLLSPTKKYGGNINDVICFKFVYQVDRKGNWSGRQESSKHPKGCHGVGIFSSYSLCTHLYSFGK